MPFTTRMSVGLGLGLKRALAWDGQKDFTYTNLLL